MGKKQKAAFLAGYEQGHRDGFGADRAEASREFEEQMAWDAYRAGSQPAPLPREADERANLDPAVQAAFAKASKREFDAEISKGEDADQALLGALAARIERLAENTK